MAITEIIPLMVQIGKICVFTVMKMSTVEDCLLITSIIKNSVCMNIIKTLFEPITCIILLQQCWDELMVVVSWSRSCS